MSSLGAEDQSKTRADYHRVIDINDPNIAALVDRKLVLVRPDGHVVWCGDVCPDDASALIDRVRGHLEP